MKRLIYLLIPILIGVIFAFGLNSFLDYKINSLLEKKDLTEIKGGYALDVKDKGVSLNNYFLENDDMMIIGASDLIHETRQRPDYFFNTGRTKNEVFTIGRSLTQEIQNALELGSTNPNIKDKKIVLLAAFSWYVYPKGIRPADFQGRFAPVQFYKFFENPDISDKTKIEFANRISDLLEGSEEYKTEKIYADVYSGDNLKDKVLKGVLTPYFKFREGLVSLKEKGILYKKLVKLEDKSTKTVKEGKPIDWDAEFKLANKDSSKRVGNNPFGVDQHYYDKLLKEKLPEMKDKFKGVDIVNSKEMDDYIYFLNVCEDLGIKPTVVLIPGLPKYYEYAGVTLEDQQKLYKKISKLAKDRGFEVVDTSDKAGSKYYMRDVMHIGTVGWTDVSKQLYEIYNQEIENKEANNK